MSGLDESALRASTAMRYTRSCALVIGLLGALVLAGWAADIALLKTALPGMSSMKPNSALCFILASFGLYAAAYRSRSARTVRITAGFAVTVIGAATLAQYVGQWNFGIDELLFTEPDEAYASLYRTRMHPTTAFTWMLGGLGLTLLDWQVGKRFRPTQALAVVVLALGFGTFLCYLFGITEFRGISRFGQMAAHTTIGFMLLAIGLLAARAEAGFMPLIVQLKRGARLARLMLLAALLIPFSVGFITLLCVRLGMFGNEFGLAVQIVVTSICFAAFVLFVAKAMATANHSRDLMEHDLQQAQQELERRVAERTTALALANQQLQAEIAERQQGVEALRQSEEKTRSMVDSANAGIVTADRFGFILSWNQGAATIFGYGEAEMVGQPLAVLIPPALRALHAAGLQRFVETGQKRLIGTTVEVMGVRKDGSEVPIELSLGTWKSGGEDFFSGIIVDIGRRKKAEADLVAAKDMAEAGARAKGDFLATMSHEIRTPMNGIIGMIGFLLDSPLAEEQRNFAETARNSAESLLVIINDILDFSKIEAGKLQIERVPFDLQTAAEEVVDLLADRIEGKGLDLLLNVAPELDTQLVGDPGRVRQVLLNLATNAVKFTERGRVEITIAPVPQAVGTQAVGTTPELRVTVQDTGIGIAPDRQGALFEKFTQADVSTTRRFGGTGLGLAICRRLIGLMGGTIGFDSAPGIGSTFWFTLPVGAAIQTPRAVSPAAPIAPSTVVWLDGSGLTRAWAARWLTARGIVHTTSDSLLAFQRAGVHPGAEGEPSTLIFIDAGMAPPDDILALRRALPPTVRIAVVCRMAQRSLFREWRSLGFCALLARPLRPSLLHNLIHQEPGRIDPPSAPSLRDTPRHRGRVLLAEDNLVNQRVAARLLERLGLRVDVAGNGVDAVDLATRLPYDLVFMDCQMPEMDGFAATAALRKIPATRDLHIIALTANALSDDRQRCLDAGMDDYLSKPVRFEELKVIVERWLPFDQSGAKSVIATQQ